MRIERHTASGWWLEEAGEPTPRPALNGDVNADVVVIGGGFTGLWTAWHLLEARPRRAGGAARGRGLRPRSQRAQRRVLRVALAERGRAARPASATPPRASCSTPRATPWARSATGAARTTWTPGSTSRATCACPRRPASTTWAWRPSRPPRRWGRPSAWSSSTRRPCALAATRPVFRGGVMVPDFATLHPARLALGLRARLIERGALVYEHSPRALAAPAPRRRRRAGGDRRAARSGPARRCSRSARPPAACARCARASRSPPRT